MDKARFSYLARGFYARQVRRFLDLFPPANIKIILFEELIRDIPGTTRDILAFLGCHAEEYTGLFPLTRVHSSRLTPVEFLKAVMLNRDYVSVPKSLRPGRYRGYPVLKPHCMKELLGRYREDILELEQLIQRDLSLWSAASSTPGAAEQVY